MRPLNRTDEFDPTNIAGDPLPGLAHRVDDCVVVRLEAVREEAFLEVKPESLDRVQFGRVGRQEDGCDDVGHDEVIGAVSAGAVHEGGLGTRRHLAAELVEKSLDALRTTMQPTYLIIEPNHSGHYMVYATAIARSLRDADVIIATTTAGARSAPVVALLAENGLSSRRQLMVHAFDELDQIDRRSHAGSAMLAGMAMRLRFYQAVFRRLTAGQKFDHVIIPYLDCIWYTLVFRRRLFEGVPWSGIVMRRRFHLAVMGMQVTLRWLDRLDRFLFPWVMRRHRECRIGALEPYLAAYAQRLPKEDKERVVFVPDPPQRLPAVRDHKSAKAQLGLRPDRRHLLVYGEIGERKGISLLIAALQRDDWPAEVVVVLAGRGAAQAAAGCETVPGGAEVDGSRHGRVVAFDGFQPDDSPLFVACDIVWLAYTDHHGPSGVMVQAGRAGKPVLACSYGIIGFECRTYDLGIVVESPAEVCLALSALLDRPGLYERLGGNGRRHFAARDPDNFSVAVHDLINLESTNRELLPC